MCVCDFHDFVFFPGLFSGFTPGALGAVGGGKKESGAEWRVVRCGLWLWSSFFFFPGSSFGLVWFGLVWFRELGRGGR